MGHTSVARSNKGGGLPKLSRGAGRRLKRPLSQILRDALRSAEFAKVNSFLKTGEIAGGRARHVTEVRFSAERKRYAQKIGKPELGGN
jgi:hypothetical protein